MIFSANKASLAEDHHACQSRYISCSAVQMNGCRSTDDGSSVSSSFKMLLIIVLLAVYSQSITVNETDPVKSSKASA